jgi:hypothetical protein
MRAEWEIHWQAVEAGVADKKLAGKTKHKIQ